MPLHCGYVVERLPATFTLPRPYVRASPAATCSCRRRRLLLAACAALRATAASHPLHEPPHVLGARVRRPAQAFVELEGAPGARPGSHLAAPPAHAIPAALTCSEAGFSSENRREPWGWARGRVGAASSPAYACTCGCRGPAVSRISREGGGGVLFPHCNSEDGRERKKREGKDEGIEDRGRGGEELRR